MPLEPIDAAYQRHTSTTRERVFCVGFFTRSRVVLVIQSLTKDYSSLPKTTQIGVGTVCVSRIKVSSPDSGSILKTVAV